MKTRIFHQLLLMGLLLGAMYCKYEEIDPLLVDFKVNNSNIQALEPIQFEDNSEGAMTWAWSFGNGNTSDEKTPSAQTYLQPGNYIVTLTVTNGKGASETKSMSISVGPPGPVDAAFIAPEYAMAGQPITFENSSSFAASHYWDFGDNQFSSDRSPTHSYSAPGTYIAKLTVANSNGSDTISTSIIVTLAIKNPGPTALEGFYKRSATGYLLEFRKIFNGVYLIENPGGSASVAGQPYFIYNYRSTSNGDSLVFPIQKDKCNGGLQLVGPSAPLSLSSLEYSQHYPPVISSVTPFVIQWRVYEFETANPSAVNPGQAICTWGTGIRTFEKQ